ncbi:unnamed protein product [Microthlaspi erraticum]|uniref:Dof zinc finger protein n=1 Tax=Microthlaspi erraticum TaxID=1685480 RepID=A0A6D2KRG3_9BRAS|nr:unnamed protein product [Microthlaspi erraticum]
MDNIHVLLHGDNQVVKEKPPPRVCPRCKSDDTKFCFYNNYNDSQPRYNCKSCRRFWTHGGRQRNIPVGGRSRKAKRAKVDQPSVPQVVSVEIQQVNHPQPIVIGGSSSSAVAVGNHFGSLPEINGEMVLPFQSYPQMDHLDFSLGLFQQDYYNIGPDGLFGYPLINQTIGSCVDYYNGYGVNQEDQDQNFAIAMNMNHNDASTSGSRGSL